MWRIIRQLDLTMNGSLSVECQCEWLQNARCCEPIYKENDGKRYCVLHFPQDEKQHDFELAIENRFDEKSEQYLDFCGVWFPEGFSFAGRKFLKRADFSTARFSGDQNFSGLTFKEVDFTAAQFLGRAWFEKVEFRGEACFSEAHFHSWTSFVMASFSDEARFDMAHFDHPTDFAGVEFDESVSFFGSRFGNLASFGPARHDTSVLFLSMDYHGAIVRRSRFGKEANFRNSSFEDCRFHLTCFAENLVFQGVVINRSVDFSMADVAKADFSGSHLAWANFDGAFFLGLPRFSPTNFTGNTTFNTARLPGVDFSGSTFNGPVDFTVTRFDNSIADWEKRHLQECQIETANNEKTEALTICFTKTIFKDGLTFVANQLHQERTLLMFDDAVFEKPDRVKFQSVSMPPHSFMSVDPRKLHFLDVRWGFLDRRKALDEAIAAIKKHGGSYSLPMLELAYRQLAVNAEENNRYRQAADLRYLAMEVARRMRWRRVDVLNFAFWYWILSGYGEKVRRAFAALVIVWLAFAIAYWSLRDPTWWQPKQVKTTTMLEQPHASPPIAFTLPEALLYSANVMALQKPEPLPAHWLTKLLVLAETIFGPLQAALLVLAIRRKFMR
jgi:uncharacterized protein YjbI with pentapeptide repeats